MKKAGVVSAETKARILKCATDEFSKKGYQNSSLRQICANAGVTTGALYFFFKNKDDLFNKIITSVTQPVADFYKEHFQKEKDFVLNGNIEDKRSDFKFADYLIDNYLSNRQIWDIFLSHLNYYSIKEMIHSFIEKSTEHYEFIIKKGYERKLCNNLVDRFSLHQFVHMQVSTLLTLFYHNTNDDELAVHANSAIKMLRGAFFALLKD